MSTFENKVLACQEANNLKSLQKLLSKTEEDDLAELIKERISCSSFVNLWNFLLKGLSLTPNLKAKKFHFVMQTLRALESREIPSSQVNDILSYISADLPKYDTETLLELIEFCLEGLQNNVYCQFSWKEIFPEIITILSERELINYNGSEMNGKEFKKQLLNTLCMLQWAPSRVTAVASMFINMSLSKEEHFQVVNKLGTYVEKLTPQEIPGFIFQLLKLCKDQNCKSVFMRLQSYFGIRIYDANIISDSESTNLDAIESASNQDLLEAESTVLYHIHSLALFSTNSIKEYLCYLRNAIKAPEYILHPFQLTILLTISTIQHYQDKVFEILKSCVSNYYNENHRREMSCWFHEMVPKLTNIDSIFTQVLNVSLQDRDTVLQGLVNFAFVLMNVKRGLPLIFIDPNVEKQWNLGMLILFKIIRHKRHNGGIIIQEIINNVLTDQNITQYIECLYLLSRNLTLILLENQSCIIEVMEDLTQIPGNTAMLLLDAIMPLTKVSSTVRDHLILLLRKALYSSKTDTRQMAVMGYIKLLTTLKISSAATLSQLNNSFSSFSSGHSLFTQLSLNRSSQNSQNSFSNEALCLEILGILKRCFMQKIEVRNQLYDGLFGAVCQNIEIREPVLNILWIHFSNYFIIEEDTLPPLDFSKISITKDIDVIQQEPLGKLIHVIGLIIIQGEDDTSPTVEKFVRVLDSICNRMINCELINFELDDGSDLSDILPESQQKVILLTESMRIYEALIAYKLNSWDSSSMNNNTQIISLFQGYNRLVHFSKNIGKSKKENKKKNEKNNETDLTIHLNDASINNSNKKKEDKKNFTFKIPETILDFQTVIRALQLLHQTMVDWTTMQEANVVKSKREVHRHLLQSTLHLITSLKSKKNVDSEENRKNFKNVQDIAQTLFNDCIKTLDTFIDFDCTSAVLVSDCFYAILNYISSSHKKNILLFLRKIVQKDDETLENCISEIIQVYRKLFVMDDELENEDAEIKKLSLNFINTLNLLSNFIPSETTSLSIEFYDWLNDYAKNQILKTKTSVTPFFNLLFSMQIKFKKDVTLINEIINNVGTLVGMNEESEVEKYQIVNELTAQNAYVSVTSTIKILLDEIDWIINRCKSEYTIIINTDNSTNIQRRENLVIREKGISTQLCLIVKLLEDLCNVVGIPPGPLSDALFKIICQFYTTITNFTKYFTTKSTKYNTAFQAARFEKLVKMIGRNLSPKINDFITNLEQESKKEDSTQKKKSGSKKNLKIKILKDTRLIPKIVYGMEQFSSSIMQLSNKTKTDLSKYIGQGTTRDFRIMTKEIEAYQKEVEQSQESGSVGDDTVENSTQGEQENEDESNVSEAEEEPPKKRTRKLRNS